jgi:hypothetical protein
MGLRDGRCAGVLHHRWRLVANFLIRLLHLPACLFSTPSAPIRLVGGLNVVSCTRFPRFPPPVFIVTAFHRLAYRVLGGTHIYALTRGLESRWDCIEGVFPLAFPLILISPVWRLNTHLPNRSDKSTRLCGH